jgi:probable F420-dependent oxidoreductase
MSIASRTRIGISSPHIFPDGTVDMALVRRYAARAEELGYSSLWTQERVTGTPVVLDPIPFLSYLAGQTTRARIGVSVLVLARHNVVHLAKHLASLDQMSGGRLIVGLGLGANAADLATYGVPPERRVLRFNESIAALRSLWAETPATFQGELVSVKGVNIEPKPAQNPLPIWFGANAEAAVERAVRHGNGWTGAGSSLREVFPQRLALAKRLREEAGKTKDDFPLSKRVYLALDENESRARERLTDWFGYYYGNRELMEKVAVYGAPSRVQEQLAAWSEAGVDEFILNPVYDQEAHLEQLAKLTGLV